MPAMTPQEIEREVLKNLGRGLEAGAIFLKARVKETLSVPAPRKRVLGKRGKNAGVYYYRATTPATPGAPPRKLSGRLRSSITHEMSNDGLTARVGTNVEYAQHLEEGGHAYLITTLEANLDNLARIIGQEQR